MNTIADTFAVRITVPAEDVTEFEALAAHILDQHDETVESLTELVADFTHRHSDVSILEAIEAVHMFQTDAAEAGDWDAGHTH